MSNTMDNKLQDALKKANDEVKKAGITDPELKKIAFSKAIDFYIQGGKDLSSQPVASREKGGESNFWSTLSASTDIDEKKLKDVYSVDNKQVRLVIDKNRIPGDSKADKQRSLAALVLLAYHEGLGHEWVSSGFLAEAAKHSKLYDTSKYAKNLKYDWFRSQGIRRGLSYKLSGPGVSQARSLISTITQ